MEKPEKSEGKWKLLSPAFCTASDKEKKDY